MRGLHLTSFSALPRLLRDRSRSVAGPRRGREAAGGAEPWHGPTSAGSLPPLKAAISRPAEPAGKAGGAVPSPRVTFPRRDSWGPPLAAARSPPAGGGELRPQPRCPSLPAACPRPARGAVPSRPWWARRRSPCHPDTSASPCPCPYPLVPLGTGHRPPLSARGHRDHRVSSAPSVGASKLRLVMEDADGPGEPSDEERARFYVL